MTPVDDATLRQLVRCAAEVRLRAYAPYSRFFVGAALLGSSGRVHVGCNVENASYGLCQCAERNAIAAAVAAGEREFRAIAVVGGDRRPATPCGACRQVMVEFAPHMVVAMAKPDDLEHLELALAEELLPRYFAFGDSP